ncbi:ATP-dependent DNA ligase [Candidatus Gottesmanbacteria bacterium]|nr:ATP-dependent DNA ligase [Candidatus Gottesmanbacteria bacterium]
MTFKKFSEYLSKLESTSSRLAMTEILSDLFTHAHEDEIGSMCYFLQGRVAPLFEDIEFGIADKFMIRAVATAYGTQESQILSSFKKHGDLGIAAQENYRVSLFGSHAKELSVVEVFNKLKELALVKGTGSQEIKIGLLSEILTNVDALSARFIVRIPLDKLRLGFSEMTILDALSWMISKDKSNRVKLEEAYNVRPDIGSIAEIVKKEGMKGLSHLSATVGAPILPALCQRIPTAEEMIEKMGKVAVEPKYDGERVQLHYAKSKIKNQKSKIDAFSRNLERIESMFPELQKIGDSLRCESVVLDSEVVGLNPKTGAFIPFQETMTRKRKYNISEAVESVPIVFFVFDMLVKDGKDLLSTPFCERRAILEKTIVSGKLLKLSPQILTDDPEKIRQYHDEQRRKGLEGIVVKKWESPYEPGRKGFSWVKLKEEEGKTGKLTDTIDAVVMGYTSGEGKRTEFGIGQMLLGVKKDEPRSDRGEEIVTVSKLGSGTTEEELGILFTMLKKLRVKTMPKEYALVDKIYIPDFWVRPSVVLEIAGDDLTVSGKHGAGIAVRFPRLVKIREDKSVREITTVKELQQMYHNQSRLQREGLHGGQAKI